MSMICPHLCRAWCRSFYDTLCVYHNWFMLFFLKLSLESIKQYWSIKNAYYLDYVVSKINRPVSYSKTIKQFIKQLIKLMIWTVSWDKLIPRFGPLRQHSEDRDALQLGSGESALQLGGTSHTAGAAGWMAVQTPGVNCITPQLSGAM